MEPAGSEQTDAHYEQVWQDQLIGQRQAVQDLQQQQEQARFQLQENHAREQVQLTDQQEAERNTLLRYHREQRIALRESQL